MTAEVLTKLLVALNVLQQGGALLAAKKVNIIRTNGV